MLWQMMQTADSLPSSANGKQEQNGSHVYLFDACKQHGFHHRQKRLSLPCQSQKVAQPMFTWSLLMVRNVSEQF